MDVARTSAWRRRGGDDPAVGQVCEEHGSALYLLAWVLTGNREEAVPATVEVIAEAFTQAGDTDLGDDRELRRELARRVYLRCAGSAHDGVPATSQQSVDQDGSTVPAAIVSLSLLAEQQRVCLGLGLFGGYTYAQIAELVDLPTPTVADLLRSGLRELSSSGAAA